MRGAILVAGLLLVVVVAGCVGPPGANGEYTKRDGYGRDEVGDKPDSWPDLAGERITVLGNGAFGSCKEAASRFENLTRVKVTCESGPDAVRAVQDLVQHKGQYDVVYGLDNALLQKAQQLGLVEEYRPALADRIDPSLIFFPAHTWPATPVDYGFVAVNVDANGNRSGLATVNSLAKVRSYADQFVTPDPANSSPGLAFLLITIAKYGENPGYGVQYDWKSYWRDLLRGTNRPGHANPPCVLVAADWTKAYEGHFTNAGRRAPGADKPIVVSYSESPAVEVYFGSYPAENRSKVITEEGSVWHQIQTMAIVNGTRHREAAQAWVEYTLTDHFQGLRAPVDAVYPAVLGINATAVFAGLDPDPATLRPAKLEYQAIGTNLDRWQREWRALYEDTNLNCRK